MNCLLDTCAFLWLVRGDQSLSPRARELVVNPRNRVFLSAISAWEIGVKHGLGRLQLPIEPIVFVPRERERHRIELLSLDENASLCATTLPLHHKDPFDRLLVGQALAGGLTLLTPDPLIRLYNVPTDW